MSDYCPTIRLSPTSFSRLSHIFISLMLLITGSMVARILGGAMSDNYGASRPMGVALIVASLATGLTALVESGPALCVCRFLSGVGGGTLIIAQAWTAAMFSKNIIGTAMGLVLGIGYTGNGFAHAFLGSALLPPLTTSMGESRAWRTLLLITCAVGVCGALTALCLADDTPEAKFYRRKIEKSENEQSSSILSKLRASTLRRAAKHYATWILALQYALSSGTNTALLNIAESYFVDEESATSSQASAVTSVVGWLGLTCFLGGLLSDRANKKMGLKGRYCVQFTHLVLEGVLLIIFPFVKNFYASSVIFIFASMMATWAVGSTSALVPYVDRAATGSVAGIVGFNGGLGGILMILISKTLGDTYAFSVLGTLVILAACLSFFLRLDDIVEVKKDDNVEVKKDDNAEVKKDEDDNLSSV